MESTALNELIAQVRATAATLAEAEQRVVAFKNELAQQKLPDASSALLGATPMPKHANSGWLPANGLGIERSGRRVMNEAAARLRR
jgi:hypothetical protein